jgi:hypothetical protein
MDFVTTGHSLGGGLASAAAVAGDIHADTFNAAGLLETSLSYDLAGQPQLPNPGELERYRNAHLGLVDAYFLDWDILSLVQDMTPLQDAIGHRIKMDGPLDLEIQAMLLTLAPLLASGISWGGVFLSLGGALQPAVKCHMSYYYFYGLMVDEETGWDIYGYTDF